MLGLRINQYHPLHPGENLLNVAWRLIFRIRNKPKAHKVTARLSYVWPGWFGSVVPVKKGIGQCPQDPFDPFCIFFFFTTLSPQLRRVIDEMLDPAKFSLPLFFIQRPVVIGHDHPYRGLSSLHEEFSLRALGGLFAFAKHILGILVGGSEFVRDGLPDQIVGGALRSSFRYTPGTVGERYRD
jgi:hypothetical protein